MNRNSVHIHLDFVMFAFTAHTKIYGCEVRRRHHLERKEGGGFDREEYEKFPSKYISTFSKKVGRCSYII
jgi:alpha-aminoadipic semialdehyde synthase